MNVLFVVSVAALLAARPTPAHDIAAAGATGLPLSQVAPSTAPVPFSVLSSQVDAVARTVTFVLQNTGTKVITAWDVEIVTGTEPNLRSTGFGIDAYREFAGLIAGRSYINPQETITATSRLPEGFEPADPVVVRPRTAIFADCSIAGNGTSARSMFDLRARHLAAWREVLSQLEAARSRPNDIQLADLEQILATVSSTIAQRGGDIVRATFRANLSIAVQDVRAGRAHPAVVVNKLFADAQRNVALGTAHANRQVLQEMK